MEFVYLDLNSWIDLHMRDEDDDLRSRFEAAVDEGDIAVPLIHTLLREEATFENKDVRADVFDYMFEISNSYALRSYDDVGFFEVERFVCEIQGLQYDLQSAVRGQGVDHLFGHWNLTMDGEPLKRDAYPELYSKIERILKEKPGFDVATEAAVQLAEDQEDWESDLFEEVQDIQSEWNQKFNDNAQRRRYAKYYHFYNSVFPSVAEELVREGEFYDFSKFDFEGYVKNGDDEVERLFQYFPSHYTYIVLTNARDLQDGGQPNDIYDLFSLRVAIPYSDIVVTEKFWKAEADRAGLDDIYGTDVQSSLDALPGILG